MRLVLCLVSSRLVLSRLVLSCVVLHCPVSSRLALSIFVMNCLVLSFSPLLFCCFAFVFVFSCLLLSCFVCCCLILCVFVSMFHALTAVFNFNFILFFVSAKVAEFYVMKPVKMSARVAGLLQKQFSGCVPFFLHVIRLVAQVYFHSLYFPPRATVGSKKRASCEDDRSPFVLCNSCGPCIYK